MKTIIFSTLIALSAISLPAAQAANLDPAQWDAFCKKHEQRCETAVRLCEQNDRADCDEIRSAFMLGKPIPSSVIPSTSDN